ncbi:MAG: class I SAM-dependent methyltransferase, partial [Bdellovibrio sp.]|nr:class I SAM-dependent methyltransferase [Bdellovibrio sp.]
MKAHEFFSRKDVLAFEDNFDKNSFQTEYIINQIGQGKKVLDVGCGSGSIAQLIQMHHNEVWAVELNKEAATKAIERGIRVQVADIEDGLKFANSSFDVVCA